MSRKDEVQAIVGKAVLFHSAQDQIDEEIQRRLHDNQERYFADPITTAERAVVDAAVRWRMETLAGEYPEAENPLEATLDELLRLRAAQQTP